MGQRVSNTGSKLIQIVVLVKRFRNYLSSLDFSIKTSVNMHENLCSIIFSENKFVIVGGFNQGSLSSVEVLNEYQHLSCNIPSYPVALYGHSSTITTSGILVCGGLFANKKCYEYRSSSNSWISMPPMNIDRSYFDMLHLKQKVWAVGGSGGRGSAKSSMEIYEPNSMTWTKQSIPFNVSHHCIAQLSANQFILIGGRVSKNVMTKNMSIQQFDFFTFHYAIYFFTKCPF